MKKLAYLFFALLSAASAQILEDYSCIVPVLITNTSPAVVTCPTPHHFNMRAYANVTLASPVSNDTLTMDGLFYRFVTTLDNNVPRQVLIGSVSADSAANLAHAVNDDGIGKGALYSSATTANTTIKAYNNYTAAQVEMYYRMPGAAGIGIAVSSSNNTRMVWDQALMRMDWNVAITGATGNWTSIGTNGIPKHMIARYVSPTQFSLWLTVTAPYSAASNGLFLGQKLQMVHETLANLPFPNNARAESWGNYSYYTSDPFFAVTVPSCTDPTHEIECSMAYRNLESSTKYAGKKQTISSFVVSSQVATITFASAFPFIAGDSRNLRAGSLLWVRNIADPAGTWTHTSTYANDSSGTVQNHLVKFIQGTNTVGAVARENGGAIGVCISGCGTSGIATIADGGLITCSFSNAAVAGHWVTVNGLDDTCIDAGVNFPFTNFQFGVVQDTGPVGLHKVWISGINRAFTVQSVNGPGDGTNVTRATINTPGYPDGTYPYLVLPGYLGSPWGGLTPFAGINYTGSPYVYFIGGSNNGPYRHVSGLLQRSIRDASVVDYSKPMRISAWIKYGKNQSSCGTQVGSQMGSYTLPPGFPPTNNAAHYYHFLDHPGYAGQWSLITLNSTPSHQEGHIDGTAGNYAADVGWVGGPYNWNGQAHYWESMENYYYDVHGVSCTMGGVNPVDDTGQTLFYSPATMTNDTTAEPEELVTGRGGVWAPHLFQAADTPYTPTGSPGYDLYWQGPKGLTVQYEIRYSTIGSLKQLGFSNGLCKNGTVMCGSLDRTTTPGALGNVYYQSGPMNQQSNIWWGIKPISVPVLGTTGTGANPSWVITLVDTGIQAGDRATVTGVNSFANQTNVAVSAARPYQTWMRFDPVPNRNAGTFTYVANPGGPIKITLSGHGYLTGQTIQLDRPAPAASYDGRYTITVLDGNTFTLDGTSYDASCTPCSGGGIRLNVPDKLVNIVSNGSICTATLTVNHNLIPGWKVYVWGSPNAVLTPNSAASGDDPKLFTVATTPTPQSFTFTCAGVPAGTYDTDAPGGSRFGVQSLPAVAFPVTGTANYTSGGTIFSNEDKRGFAEIQLYPYTQPTLLSQRFGGVITSTAAIFLYVTPDSNACTLAVTGSGAGTGTVMDGGGQRSRSRVWTGLTQNTMYQFSLTCGAYFATGGFTTPASLLSLTSGSVQIDATPPAVAAAADNLVIDYGDSATLLDQSINMGCSVGARCSTSFTRSLDSVVWVRRRWCMNRTSDPTCSTASNEVARSSPEAITVR